MKDEVGIRPCPQGTSSCGSPISGMPSFSPLVQSLFVVQLSTVTGLLVGAAVVVDPPLNVHFQAIRFV
jgi:hypothetical protein